MGEWVTPAPPLSAAAVLDVRGGVGANKRGTSGKVPKVVAAEAVGSSGAAASPFAQRVAAPLSLKNSLCHFLRCLEQVAE